MTAPHTSDLDHALTKALPNHGADYVHFTDRGHTADAWIGDEHFAATAGTSTAALAAAMTGLRAAMGGAA